MPIRGQPRYNPRRRSGLGCWLNYQQSGSECAGPTSSIGSSNSSWTNSHYHTFSRLMNSGGPPSPCPSDQPFNSASSSLSESSSSHRSQEDDISIVTGNLLSLFIQSSLHASSHAPLAQSSQIIRLEKLVIRKQRDSERAKIVGFCLTCESVFVCLSTYRCGLYVL